MAKKTQEEYVNELEINNPKITVIGDYVNASTPILHKCKIHNYEWMVTPSNILRRDGCPKCNGRYRRTHDEYVEELKIVNPNLEVIGTYINATTKILHRCKTHNVVWMKSPENALNGSGCKQCSNDILSSLFSKTHEEYIKELADLNPNVEVLEKYNGALKGILHRCRIDGYEWYVSPSYMLSGCVCPSCNNSKGENEVKSWLELHNISFVTQKRFEDCKDKRYLPFDFYLPDHNVCIEYDGEQHFRPIGFGCKDESLINERFESLQKHDQIKNEYCETKGIRLIRIPYFDDVKEKLDLLLA